MEQEFQTEIEDVEINITPNKVNESVYGVTAKVDFRVSFDVRSYGIKDATVFIKGLYGSFILENDDEAIEDNDIGYSYDWISDTITLHNEDTKEYTIYNNVNVVVDVDNDNPDFRIVIREIVIDLEEGGDTTITVSV